MKTFIRFLLAAQLSAAPLHAFGRNQVGADSFRWRIARTAHFDIHHTDESKPLVPMAAKWAERAYERLTKSLDVVPAGRISLFIYANHNQFEQNNIAEAGEGTGGVTEAFKNRVVVFNSGAEAWLDHVITHEFTHVLQFEALYGGFWKSARLLKSPLYPLWFMEGLAEYGVGDIDRAEEDMYLRDAALGEGLYSLTELHGFNHLKPHQVTLAYKSGASAVRFIAEEYGADVPGRMLKGLRERFEVASVAGELTRQDFRSLDARWREHLTDGYRAQAKRLGLKEPAEYGARLTGAAEGLPVFNRSPVLSPDGGRLAFITDRPGHEAVAVTDLATGVTRVVAGRQWGMLEHIHGDGKALSFSPDGRWLAFAGEKEQRDFLYLYDLKRARLRRVRTPFGQIRSPVFHPEGDRLAVVGMTNGTNDIYEITPRGKLVRRLTEGAEDEGDPAWSPDGKTLAFSRERPGADRYQRDLVLLDAASRAVRLLPSLPGDERTPAWTPDGAALLFSGESLEGVRNLYRMELPGGAVTRLTRVLGGAFGPEVSRDGARMVFSSFRRNAQDVYLGTPELWNPPADRREAVAAAPPDGAAPAAPPAAAVTGEGPYRFSASTDLFFPLLYYSSQDGLFIAALWQASEHLGHHAVSGNLQYGSGEDFLDYQLQYTYRRFRPQFFVGIRGEAFYRDFERIEQRREWERTAGIAYPLDRFQRLELAAIGNHWEDRYRGIPLPRAFERENVARFSFVRDTSTGRYLAVTDGARFRLTRAMARPVAGGTRDYDETQAEWHRFLPTGGEGALAFRGVAGLSTGPSPRLFRIGGGDRLRGYARNDAGHQASRYVLGNLEWRVPLKYMDAGVSFLPEIAMKALFGTLFVDAGYDATPGDRQALGVRRPRASAGAGLRIPSFILQTYPVILSVDVAKRLDDSAWSWYFSLGPKF